MMGVVQVRRDGISYGPVKLQAVHSITVIGFIRAEHPGGWRPCFSPVPHEIRKFVDRCLVDTLKKGIPNAVPHAGWQDIRASILDRVIL
ncbi:hypothetical protein [Komagataeibacter sp. FNDCR2]|uniref:hypothetical protein n=1 Tax=Komagataeibacter sp. FNDCR2 TaxID=2878682 RepID=UPI001E29B2F4|nr:hypothetical protein [Komagataeibacter sp. FNDCR2]MCE2574814.1 hypothetical protein [Komagataeibacter sp. FNDCR2]